MRVHYFRQLLAMDTYRHSISAELDLVNDLIVEQLKSKVPMVENVGHYIVDAGGKRLRPLLVLLCGAALGNCNDKHITFATIIEFIHTATLLHDDVVDISSLRRGQPTANAEFGNAPSVLVGDFLYSRAFQLLIKLDDMDILSHLADTTNTIAEGEVMQLSRAGDPNTTAEQYLEIITNKTAILFAAACYGAATLSGFEEDVRRQQHAFGLNLGIAFQMIDDVLDYEGDPKTMGKNIGDDLTEGKPTLPLIFTLANGTDEEQALVEHAITHKSAENISRIVEAVARCGALDFTRSQALHYHDLAQEHLKLLPPSEHRSAMMAITALSINRDH